MSRSRATFARHPAPATSPFHLVPVIHGQGFT
jgi:hypothetical protein